LSWCRLLAAVRAKSIKLAGFKSFVDPCVVNLHGNLTAIVGPNGCGKSNIIDAVRWVMGEGSAKTLRGESMADVIFSGSGSRQPVGQASIELIFDNEDGALGGALAGYAQIAIRRQVSRDGQSHYQLNGAKCRRRDITDLFLGTGLGPRSYAIIEQGMISRLVEARPEELRSYIEEAAGISRYKERRRESESRIRRTEENLARLDDLRKELARSLERLQRQAQTAEKYRELMAAERETRAALAALRLSQLQAQQAQHQRSIETLSLCLEKESSTQRHIEASLLKLRENGREQGEANHRIQARLYATGAELARIEQNISHHQQRLRQLQKELDEAQRMRQRSEQQSAEDKTLLASLAEQRAVLDKQHALAQSRFAQASAALEQAEAALLAVQSRWEQSQQAALEPAQRVSILQAQIAQLEPSVARLAAQQQRVREQSAELVGSFDTALLDEQLAESGLESETRQSKLAQANVRLADLREQWRAQQQAQAQMQADLQPLREQLAALCALQKAALNPPPSVADWLHQQHLSERPKLAERLRVEPGWEAAVACVLGADMQATLLDKDFADCPLAGFNAGRLHLRGTACHPPGEVQGRLLDKIREGREFVAELATICTVETLAEALAQRLSLEDGQTLVSRDGGWVGRNFLRLCRGEAETSGLLVRREEIEQLSQDCEQREARLAEAGALLQQLEEQLQEQERLCEQMRRAASEQSARHAQLTAQHSAAIARAAQMEKQRAQLALQADELAEQLQMESEQLGQARLALAEALQQREASSGQSQDLQQRREACQAQVQALRHRTREQQEQLHRLALQQGRLRERYNATEAALARLTQQVNQLSERREQLALDLQQGDEPLLIQREQLEGLLAQRLAIEDELQQARQAQQQTEQALREMERRHNQSEQTSQQLRRDLESARLAVTRLAERAKVQQEQLQQEGFSLDVVLAGLSADMDEARCQAKQTALAAQIQRLGAVNLAAMEEYQQQSERKTYLDAQNDDLLSALATLSSVIRKIDRETKSRFVETFERVNQGLQNVFPKIFGGGSAFLQLTGDDLLETGVTLMARPPGKKNSHLALLSGGEKALTALALVFAIFNLNPAPFCLLDEVDAPLDDANVERYARLVKEMSAKVQFIYITHNKIAMQMASHLLGVTMHEPGCSRLVTVDIDEALAQAG